MAIDVKRDMYVLGRFLGNRKTNL